MLAKQTPLFEEEGRGERRREARAREYQRPEGPIIHKYVKVEQGSFSSIFKTKRISANGRLVFYAMSQFLPINSNQAEASFAALREETGLRSNQTISNALKELLGHKLIDKLPNNGRTARYRISGIYNGRKEAPEGKKAIPFPSKAPTPSACHHMESRMTAPVKLPIKGVNTKKQDKQQTQDDDVSFKKFNFSENSPFKSVSSAVLGSLCRDYGEVCVFSKLRLLEKQYPTIDSIKKTAVGLLYSALKHDYQVELVEDTKKAMNAEKQESIDRLLSEVDAVDEAKSRQRAEALSEAKSTAEPGLWAEAETRMKRQYPNLERGTPLYSELLDELFLKVYERQSIAKNVKNEREPVACR